MEKINKIYVLDSTWGAQMNSFIVTTDLGGLIVIDGGWRKEAEKLLGKLREISGEEKPHIDAWILTHCHSDHIDAFKELIEKYRDEFTFDKLYYNFPSFQFIENNAKGDGPCLAEFYRDLPLFADKINIVSQGDRYEIKGAEIDILYTTDPSFTRNVTNNSSTVFRMTLGGKKLLFLADLGVEAGRKLLAEQGEGLKSDYCQMAHHGQQGVERQVYEAIRPEKCIWCTPLWLWNNDAGKGYGTGPWKTLEVRKWMEELGVSEHFNLIAGDVSFTV